MTTEVLLVVHTGRADACSSARDVVARFTAQGAVVRVLDGEAADIGAPAALPVPVLGAAVGADLVLALGGDGTLLRAAEHGRAGDVPVIGVNLGRVGFLAEAEPDDLDRVVDRLLKGDYTVQERVALDVSVLVEGAAVHNGWALNEVAVEKSDRSRMLECIVEVDGRPVSRWGCDGVLMATPTGSTAYAFSAGGPIVWPDVQALLLVPISAHALFARPMVASPHSTLALELVGAAPAVLSCDGRRGLLVPAGGRVEVHRSDRPVRLALLGDLPFTDRLVRKLGLPVEGWRGPA